MEKPIVRIIEPQQEESIPVEVNGYEAANLLAKYGYTQADYTTPITPLQQTPINPNAELTFEDMVKQEEMKLEQERQKQIARQYQKANQPQPYTFDGNNVNYYETKYTSDDDNQFGIRVQIVSDMNIKPNYD